MITAKILVVDDIFSNQLLLKSVIENAGIDCKVTSNGKLAIEALEKEHFDLIFMDIEMPVMNGIEATKFIRNQMSDDKKNTPIVALTAHNHYEFSQTTANVGFNEIVSKPYSPDKFKELFKKYIPEKIK